MSVPSLAPVPPASVQKSIVPEEWALCMDAWLALTHHYLLLPIEDFDLKVTKDTSFPQFLISYVKNAQNPPDPRTLTLRRNVFLLIHRTFSHVKSVPISLLDWNFWVELSHSYAGSKALSLLLSETWIKQDMDTNASMSRYKSALTRALEVSHLNPELEELLPKTLALTRSCYPYGQFLMLGSDFVDALASAHTKKPRLQKKIEAISYFSFLSLMRLERPRISTLLDHLYSLNASETSRESFVKGVVGNTPLLRKMRVNITGPESGRAKSLIDSLQEFEATPDGRAKKPIRRKVDKGKGKDKEHNGRGPSDDMHVHKLSLVSQIQDLFPDLGSGFITKLLHEYNDDTEQVTAHLLDDSLPAHLKGADRSEAIPEPLHPDSHDLAPDLAPHSTPPLPPLPVRRNIHDDDELDRLEVDASKLRLGKDETTNADTLLASERTNAQKAAILSALAAFDSDDDERDDTYDVEDVGSTVDTTNDEYAADLKQDVNEETLFHAYNRNPDLFNRDAETRRSKARAELKTETGMTDEAIEGWGIMVSRDPRRLDRMKRKFELGSGMQQRALEGTAWKGDSGTEDSDAAGGMRGGSEGRARGRGAGRGRGRGRGGEAAGPSEDKDTQATRRRKDANKASRANHNRRDQRARKLARGGFPG